MKLCSSCDAQFPDDYSECVHCHRGLEGAPPERDGVPPQLSRMHHLADEHPAKVAALLDSLREADVRFTLVTDGGTRKVDWNRGSAGHLARASIFVEADDRPRAEAIHREFLESLIPHLSNAVSTPAAPPGFCPACRDPVPPHAEECPSCGLAFPEA